MSGWITAAGALIGGILGWFMHLWRSKQEIAKIKDERDKMREEKRQMEQRLNIESCASHLHFMAHQQEISGGMSHRMFSEDELYEWAKGAGYSAFVHPALELLINTGRATPIDNPVGHWFIHWPTTQSTSRK